ncbi:hypothetical protein RSAG8_01306, partial [Rhizoctonia solani AG-8 WAC10335]
MVVSVRTRYSIIIGVVGIVMTPRQQRRSDRRLTAMMHQHHTRCGGTSVRKSPASVIGCSA